MRVFSKQQFIENGILSASRKRYCGHGTAHSHEFFEVEYILQGEGCCTVNGTAYPLKAGMLFFLSPADTHCFSSEDVELFNAMFPCSFFDSDLLFSLFAPGSVAVLQLNEQDQKTIESLFYEVVQGEPEYARHFLRCVLLKLTTLLPCRNFRPDSHIRAAIVYILEHYRSGITLQETADYLGLTAAYLSTLFQQEVGKNFKAYVDDLRFDHAVKLLRSTEMPVAEICAAAGFNDYANFSRRFRLKFGCTPGEYRPQ